ncbi:hypothetical protein CRE_15009 [Caenorhabditis remanei]|uniref:Uncharacterized protein n=1 Tax=Caenorhabditis remanei TaxID=31234 RepID=E3NIR0_CAERE|nr:hypothetical protein CRE_15009 [Caenorhabditis remanei]
MTVIAHIVPKRTNEKILYQRVYCSFTKIVHVLIARFVPTKSFKLSYKSHSSSVIKLQKEKLRIWRSQGNSTRYKEVSNLLKRRLRQEEKALHERCLENGNPKEFFNFINSRNKENSEIGVLKNKTNEPINDAFEKAEIFFSVMLTSKFSSNALKFMFVPFWNMGLLFSPPHLKNKLG